MEVQEIALTDALARPRTVVIIPARWSWKDKQHHVKSLRLSIALEGQRVHLRLLPAVLNSPANADIALAAMNRLGRAEGFTSFAEAVTGLLFGKSAWERRGTTVNACLLYV